MATHYETLGVPQGAPVAEIRRRYLALARTEHPDRRAANVDANRGDDRMREINQAWQVLRDPARRAAYDRSLATPRTVPRIDVTQNAQPVAAPAQPLDLVASIVSGLPWLFLLAVLGIIFVFTAYAAGGDREAPSLVPAVGADAGSCFVFKAGLTLPVSCETPNDGRVLDKVSLGSGGCAASVPSTYLRDERKVLCYRPPGR